VWTDRQRDRLLAVGAAAFAASIVVASRAIEDSLLSDAVGAGGVPQGVGIVMGLAAVALFAKTFIGKPAPAAAEDADGDGGGSLLPRTGGLVAILIVFGLLLPWLGYPLAISLLVGASGWLAGAAPRLPLLLCTVLSGPALWLMFDRLLQVRMPVGTLWGG
jgi:hypothetical protein